MKSFRAIFVLICLVALSASAQKVKLKKGDVLVDETAWLKYDGCGGWDSVCSLINGSGEEIVFIKFIQSEPSTNMLFNKYGAPNYYEVSFLGMNRKIEVREFFKDIIQILYNGKVVAADGTLDEDRVNRLVEKYGTSFSDKLNRGSNNTVIIRERDDDDDNPRVNISIGR